MNSDRLTACNRPDVSTLSDVSRQTAALGSNTGNEEGKDASFHQPPAGTLAACPNMQHETLRPSSAFRPNFAAKLSN